jgi:hypothetical protein
MSDPQNGALEWQKSCGELQLYYASFGEISFVLSIDYAD